MLSTLAAEASVVPNASTMLDFKPRQQVGLPTDPPQPIVSDGHAHGVGHRRFSASGKCRRPTKGRARAEAFDRWRRPIHRIQYEGDGGICKGAYSVEEFKGRQDACDVLSHLTTKLQSATGRKHPHERPRARRNRPNATGRSG